MYKPVKIRHLHTGQELYVRDADWPTIYAANESEIPFMFEGIDTKPLFVGLDGNTVHDCVRTHASLKNQWKEIKE